MTKYELIKNVSKQTGRDPKCVSDVLEGLMTAIKAANASGKEVHLRGFGTFRVVTRKAKTGRNINKGTQVMVPEHIAPAFKPCKEYKKQVKG